MKEFMHVVQVVLLYAVIIGHAIRIILLAVKTPPKFLRKFAEPPGKWIAVYYMLVILVAINALQTF